METTVNERTKVNLEATKAISKQLAQAGAKVMLKVVTDHHDYHGTYVFCAFDNDRYILYIDIHGDDKYVDVTLEYVPSKENGCGCLLKRYIPIDENLITRIKQIHDDLIKHGVSYFNKNVKGVKLYKDIEQYYSKYWDKTNWIVIDK